MNNKSYKSGYCPFCRADTAWLNGVCQSCNPSEPINIPNTSFSKAELAIEWTPGLSDNNYKFAFESTVKGKFIVERESFSWKNPFKRRKIIFRFIPEEVEK
jgi:hypothetical protein